MKNENNKMSEEVIPKKILWINIKSTIKNDLLFRNLKDPKIRLGALENLETLLKKYFYNEYCNPIEFLKIKKETLKKKLGNYKNNGILNKAEESIINNIYDYLKEKAVNNTQQNLPDTNNETIELKVLHKELPASDSESSAFKTFTEELILLKRLFGEKLINERLGRLKTIYETSEKFWEKQLKNIPEDGIRYLFIAEAPPWSSEGEVTYVYNPKSKPRTLLKALYKAFFNEPLYNIIGSEETLKRLTSCELMIFDSLPFAMDYKSKRGSNIYNDIIGKSIHSYLLPKFNRNDLNWSDYIQVGFGFKRNALAVINKFNGKLLINKLSRPIKISNEMITANDAGYPDAEKIRKVFNL